MLTTIDLVSDYMSQSLFVIEEVVSHKGLTGLPVQVGFFNIKKMSDSFEIL